MGEIVLDVQTVGLKRLAHNAIICTVVMTFKDKALFGSVNKLRVSERLKLPASGHRVNVHLVGE